MLGEYGQLRAEEPGSVVTVRDGQRVERVDITLHRGAVIAGAVTDPDGEPLEGLAMQVWRATAGSGRPAAEVVAGVPMPTTKTAAAIASTACSRALITSSRRTQGRPRRETRG